MKLKKFKTIAKNVIETEITSLRKLKKNINVSFEKAVKTILNCKNGKIVISGTGKSGIIEKKFLQLLLLLVFLLFLLMQEHALMEIWV